VRRERFGAAGAWGQCAPAALVWRGRPALNFTVRCQFASPHATPNALRGVHRRLYRDLPLTLPPNASVEVIELGGSHYTADPASDTHRNLERWVTNNRSGWAPYYATLPGKGIIVRAGSLDLQFLDSTAFAQTPQGAFHKSVAPADYGFLRRTANGT